MSASAGWLARADLGRLVEALQSRGRRVIGPRVRDGAIVYAEIERETDLPLGWREDQGPGRYRLVEAEERRTFGYTVAANGWKSFTFPADVPIGRATAGPAGLEFTSPPADAPPVAFLGVRACELAALRVQDRVLLDGPVADHDYGARRRSALVVAVECTRAGPTCFCAPMGTGPEVRSEQADLTLTELEAGFVVRFGTEDGRRIADELPLGRVPEHVAGEARAAVASTRDAMGLSVETAGLQAGLAAAADHPRWAEVAERCLGCANCTLVCPTCFCTSVTPRTNLIDSTAVTVRAWDSCFSPDFAKVAGGDFRSRPRDRYRQWLTHKFSTWVDQFGSFGCVGCGRCITWCPVGIDVREELAAIVPTVGDGDASRPAIATVPTANSFATARIERTYQETPDTTTLVLRDVPAEIRAGGPGQFVMVTRPGLPAVPISVSRYGPAPDQIELTIRAAGPATTTMSALTSGSQLGLRGPLGRAWPVDQAAGRDVVVVAGGLGLSPLRPAVDALLAARAGTGAIRIFYGARTPADRVHVGDLRTWASRDDVDLGLTVDRAPDGWQGSVGVVTQLFDQAPWTGADAVGFVCGPERMMQAATGALLDRGLASDRIFVSLERHMECGVGLCGHCQLGRFFVCRDGPVFSLAELGGDFTREGA